MRCLPNRGLQVKQCKPEFFLSLALLHGRVNRLYRCTMPSIYRSPFSSSLYLLFILIIFLIINTLPKLLPHKDDHNQVVAAPQGTVRGSSPSVSLDQLGRPQANALASALAAGNHVKIQAPTVSG